MTPFQAGLLLPMLAALRARSARPLWEPDGYSLPGYADWMPSDVAAVLRYCEANPTVSAYVGDPDPVPNERALFLLTLLGAAAGEALADVAAHLPRHYLLRRQLEIEADNRRRQARRTRRMQQEFDRLIGPKRWHDRPGAAIVRHVTVADMTADSQHFWTREQLIAYGAAQAPPNLRCAACGERAKYARDLYPARRSPRTRFVGHCGRKRCPLEVLRT